MTRGGTKRQLDFFVNELIDGSLERFKPLAVLGLGFLPLNGLFKWLLRSPIMEEIAQFRVTYNKKFKYILDYAEDLANGEGDFDEYADEILAWDYFYQNYEGDRKEEFAEDLNAWAEKIGDDIAPIVASDRDEWWDAAREEFTEDEMLGKFAHAFSLSDLLREYEDDIDLRQPRHPATLFIRLRYTEEAIRSLSESEDDLFQRMQKKASEVYG
ncbi:MAG: hypothetical protein ACLFMT_07830 [Halobacteriales archaeon]